MSATSATYFLDVLKERREHCREMLNLTAMQRPLIEVDNFMGLLDVLGRKQRIMGSLDALAGHETRLKQRWRAERATMDAELREECEHVLAETEAIFEELLQEERDSTEYLTRRRDSMRQNVDAVARRSSARAAYHDSFAQITHNHLDVGR